MEQVNFRKKINNDIINKQLKDISLNDLVNYFKENKVFQEQILIASPTLFSKLNNCSLPLELNKKECRNVGNSLINYYLRSITRHTPFGLFSGVGVVINEGNHDNYYKSIRISYDWLFKVIKTIENKHPENLMFYVNNLIKYDDHYLSIENIFSEDKDLYTDYSEPFEHIYKYKKEFSFNEICSFLATKFDDVDIEVIENYIEELINKELIISRLRPSLDIKDKLSDFIKKLKLLNYNYNMVNILTTVKYLFLKYQNSNVGNGIEIYQKIIEQLNEIAEASSKDLIVNMIYTENRNKKANIYDDDITDMVNCLAHISNKYKMQDRYLESFVDKFGTNSEVPLNIVIDNHLGIGLPRDNDIEVEIIFNDMQREINYKFWKSLKNNESLNLAHLNMPENYDLENSYISNSFEICIEHYEDNEEIKRYISPIKGSRHSNNMIGRFTLDNSSLLTSPTFSTDNDDILLCNINLIPKKTELTNVTENAFIGNATLSINTNASNNNHEIYLNNILISYSDEHLYFRDKNTGKRIIFRDMNMLNENFKNPVVAFLLKYSEPNFSTIYDYPWEYMSENMVFFPEIKYKDIIIEPRKVKLKKNIIPLNSYNEFKKNITKFIIDMSFKETPHFIFADNKIPYIESDLALNSLYKAIKKSKTDDIEFIDIPLSCQYINSYELIYNYFREKTTNLPLYPTKKMWILDNEVRFQGPSQGWIYFKVLFKKDDIDEFLRKYYSLIEIAIRKLTEKFDVFYIKYIDDNLHSLRFRIKLDNPDIYGKITVQILDLLKKLKSEGSINSFALQDYVRELERYGGIEGINICEDIFFIDTKFTNHVIMNTDEKYNYIYCCLSIYSYLKSYFISNEDILKYISNNFNVNKKDFPKFNEYFRSNKTSIERILTKNEDKIAYELLNQRNEKIIKLYIKNLLNEDLLDSLVHMTCNRILGTDREKEMGCIYLVYKFIDGLEKIKKGGRMK
ncbi:lantibiotic dehydratase [Staphylococcus gallinarum]|uniref:lantibiotic dehydratase n=1 Tax=Staphylococcus gallinarum TaxID=1293 RepID=UPI002DB827D6|nr:thiopeptide-type bacteriocin biosynthesis protein [Staphylococcus gallinarum]MEB6243534.1 lantibiotic dehydratase [Staphylococcus gallinarum]MEB6296574.1 lantibiotic dehydratase [Staphylococcus gallinarum]